MGWKRMLRSPAGVPRKFRVRQAGVAKDKLVGSDSLRREEVVGAGCRGDIVLVHTISTNTDSADQNAVAVKWKSTRKNGNAVRQIEAKSVPQWDGAWRRGVERGSENN